MPDPQQQDQQPKLVAAAQYTDLPKSAAPGARASAPDAAQPQPGYANLPKDAHSSARASAPTTDTPGAPTPSEDTNKTWGSVAGVPYKKSSFSFGNLYSNAQKGLSELGSGIYNLGADVVTNPNWVDSPHSNKGTFKGYITSSSESKPDDSTLDKFVVSPMQKEAEKAGQEWQKGNKISAAGHELAASIPMIGPWAASLGEQAGTGDVGGALAKGGAQVGVAELAPRVPGMVKGAVKSGLRAVGEGIADATPKAEAPAAATRPVARPNFDETDLVSQKTARQYGKQGMEPPAGLNVVVDGKQLPFDEWLKSQPTPKVESVTTKAEAPPSQAEVDATANKTVADIRQQRGMDAYNEKYGPGSDGSMINARAKYQITPDGIVQVEPRTQPQPSPSSAEIDEMATKEIKKIQGEDSVEQAAARNMMKHRVPSDLQDTLVKDHPDIGMRLVKGTNSNYAEMANELGMMGAKGDTWDASDFGRSGSDMSPKKAMVMRHLMENYAPEEVINMTDHWGNAPKGKK